jgi:hypothetical protein
MQQYHWKFWQQSPSSKRIEAKIDALTVGVNKLMSSVHDLKPLLDAISSDAATAAGNTASLLTKLQTLQAGGTLNAADQATLDDAVAEATTLKGAMDALATQGAQAAPVAAAAAAAAPAAASGGPDPATTQAPATGS